MTAVPDPNWYLYQLKGTVYETLVQQLKKQDAWRKLAASLPILSEASLEQKTCPATSTLVELEIKNCRVKNLRSILLRCELYDAAAVLSEPKPLTIEVQPGDGEDTDVYVPFGGELRLEIIAKGVPPPRYLWYCENEELTEQRTPILRISDFGPQHTGEYKCLVYQECDEGQYQEYSVPVNVVMLPEPPVIQEQPESKSVRVGEEVILSCRAVSYPPPTYEWIRDNTVLVGENGPDLKISHVSPSDSGMYKCSVSNGYNIKVTEAVKLSVYDGPPEPSWEKPDLPLVTEKVALLIANANYTNLDKLHTPYNDVKALSEVLKKLGFKVLSLCNLTFVEMINAVKTFSNLIPEGAYAIFYFVGHGFELYDRYMLPVECPSPDEYLCSDSLCERYVLREVLAKKPNLLLLMLDMCLKIPTREENPGMFDEQVTPISFEAQRNLIQAYATTSCLGAYELMTENNGIYMKHMLKYLSEDKPIVEILHKISRSVSEENSNPVASHAATLQIPAFKTNVVADRHYLTVSAKENPDTKALFDELTRVPNVGVLHFQEIVLTAPHKFSLYQNCFHNGLEIHLHNLYNWSIGCEIQSTGLEMQLKIIDGVKILTILNLQKLKTNSLPMTIELRDSNGTLVDNAWFEIKHMPIVSAHLWFKPPLEVDQ